MTIQSHHLSWFKLKQPYPQNSKQYKDAYARLNNANYYELEKLRSEFEFYEEEDSNQVVHYHNGDGWLCKIGNHAPVQVNMKGIEQRGKTFRVVKRVDGKLLRWTYSNLGEAIGKRDLIFSKVDA